MKTITILSDGLEVKHAFLPIIKHHYWFTEFDHAQINTIRNKEILQLMRNGERIVSISSESYSNYAALKKAILLPNKGFYSKYAYTGVVSLYRQPYLWGIAGFWGIMTLCPIAVCLFDKNPFKVVVFMLFISAFCVMILLTFLSSYKQIVVWNGQIEVRRLLWPFKLHINKLSEIDGYYRVTVISNGQIGAKDEEEWWLVKGNKLLLSISQSVYKNYDALTSATQTKCLGSLEISDFQSLKYRLFNKKL
ncbi:MAG: hypothetical protein IKX24_11045 [Prevotella sp.]|nr:hypothetical protein [Prevotella sp.]